MNPNIFCSGRPLVIILLFALDQGRAKPVANMQTLSKWLEDDLELQPVVSEETNQDQDEALLTGAVEQQEGLLPWLRSPREGSLIPEGSIQRLFSDLLGFSRRIRPSRPTAFLKVTSPSFAAWFLVHSTPSSMNS